MEMGSIPLREQQHLTTQYNTKCSLSSTMAEEPQLAAAEPTLQSKEVVVAEEATPSPPEEKAELAEAAVAVAVAEEVEEPKKEAPLAAVEAADEGEAMPQSVSFKDCSSLHCLNTSESHIDSAPPLPSQFIISLNKYLEAAKSGFAVGVRFKMRFEGDDVPEKNFSRTIVGVGDLSSQWKDSEWRSLKVQWDEPANIHCPEKVSPWEIEPFNATTVPVLNAPQPVPSKSKRPRQPTGISELQMIGVEQNQAFGTQDIPSHMTLLH